jgi:TFIIF-interacting CTD phosphatase-like protein
MEEKDFTIPEEYSATFPILLIRASICEKSTMLAASKLTHYCSLAVPETNTQHIKAPTKPKSTNILPLEPSQLDEFTCCQNKNAYKSNITFEIKHQIKAIKEIFMEIKALQIPDSLYQYPQRKTILLDLDETIAYTVPLNKKGLQMCTCTPLTGKMSRYGVIKRPYLDIFLSMLSKHYDIMVNRLLRSTQQPRKTTSPW